MKSRLTIALVLLGITIIAMVFRLAKLENRPFHGDEAVHAFKFRQLWEHGDYVYDPDEFHGPTIYYAALPFVALSGHHRFAEMQEADFRRTIAWCGIAMVPILLLLRKSMGTLAVLSAATLTSLSPACVFYSRYYIQEIFLVCFTLLFLAFAWRGGQKSKWTAASGFAAGLMIATKETAVLSFAAAGIAWIVTTRFRPPPQEAQEETEQKPISRRSLLLGIGVALLTAYLFLSGFFTHPLGPLGYFHTYTPWLRRAGGTNLHNQPWNYYLSLLAWHRTPGSPIWSEGVILILAGVGAVSGFHLRWRHPEFEQGFVRFLTLYTLVLFIIYSAIPYKTPWCVLNILSPLLLLAGIGAATLLMSARSLSLKVIWSGLLLAGVAQLGWQSYQNSFVFYMDGRNPYVYAQPVSDVVEIKNRAEELAEAHPQKFGMVIKVISQDAYYWPLPWYLRRFDNIGYWTQIPTDPDAPLVFASPEFDEQLTLRLDKTHLMTGYYGLRPAVVFETFVRMDLWEPFLKRRAAHKSEDSSR